MVNPLKAFLTGAGALLLVEILSATLFLAFGGMPIATHESPLPFEEKIARYAVGKFLEGSEKLQPPFPASEENLLQGAKVYKEQCAFCHGLPNRTKPISAAGMFPPPPQLFTSEENAAQFPVGSVYWVIKNGIRLSGMPGYDKRLKNEELWQTAQLLQEYKTLPPAVAEALK